MIKAEQIPDEVVQVIRKACDSGEPWNIRDTLAAGLAAWPLAKPCAAFFGDQSVEHTDEHVEKHMRRALILPLQETQNDQG
jgi:hypothetical protein